MSFFRKPSDTNEEYSGPTDIEALLGNFSNEELAQLAEACNQQFHQDYPVNEAFNDNQESPDVELNTQPPTAPTNKKTTTRPKGPKKNSVERPIRKTLNKPKNFNGANEKVDNDELISLVDSRLLTAAEKMSVQPGDKKNRPVFTRDNKVFETVPYKLWKEQYVWVHAVPSDGYMVYADPNEYPNIKPTRSRVLDGVLRRSLHSYGEPPVYVVRISAFCKLYNKDNQLKRNENTVNIEKTTEQRLPLQITDQHAMHMTVNPLYHPNVTVSPENEQATVQFDENFFPYSPMYMPFIPYLPSPIYPQEPIMMPEQNNVAPMPYQTNDLMMPNSQNRNMANHATFFNNNNNNNSVPTDIDYETMIRAVSHILNDPDNPKNKRKIRDDGTVVLVPSDESEGRLTKHRKSNK